MDAPTGLLVFVSVFASGETGAIRAFHIDPATGAITAAHETPRVPHPFFLALTPDHTTLYSIESETFGGDDDTVNEDVVAWRIVDRNGRLERLGKQSCKGTISCYLETDPSGRTLLAANYGSGSVVAFPIAADGSLGPAVGFATHAGSSVNPERQTKPHAHSIIPAPTPENGEPQFAYAADLGTDEIICYRVDPARATLERNDAGTVKAAPGSGPRHLRFHPDGRTLYALNELLGTITAYAYDAATGRLTPRQTIPTLPADFSGDNLAADLTITPDARYLYATNRGHDTIVIYRIGGDAMLETIDIVPSGGKGPQNLALTPDGRFLLCANMPSNNLVVFRIDDATGQLTAVYRPTEVASPSCIMIVPQ